MAGKRIIFTKHASERFLEKGVPFDEIERMLAKGVRMVDLETGAILCVYKESPYCYYTLVIDETDEQTTVITAYLSGKWQIEQHDRVKKHERSQVR